MSSAWKPTVLWLPSQKGLLALCPQRHSENAVLPCRSNALPSASTTLISAPSVASTRYGPFFLAVIVTGIGSSCAAYNTAPMTPQSRSALGARRWRKGACFRGESFAPTGFFPHRAQDGQRRRGE